MRRLFAHLIAALLGISLSSPAPAAAFSDLDRFARPIRPTAEELADPNAFLEYGGGAGRWFTGSPADPYTCEVCHDGGEPLDVLLRVLPMPNAPDGAMEIIVQWHGESSVEPTVGGNFEITDLAGNSAGKMRPTPTEQEQIADGCLPQGSGSAAFLFDASPARQVLAYIPCGGQRVRFEWVPPPGGSGPYVLSGAIVHADDVLDHESDVTGDGVTAISHMITPGPAQAYTEQLSAGCALGRTSTGSALRWLVAAALAICLRRRSRRRRVKQ